MLLRPACLGAVIWLLPPHPSECVSAPQQSRSVVYLKSPVSSRRSLNSISSEEAKRQSVKSIGSDSSSSGPGSLLTVDIKNFKAMWNEEVYQNRERWKAQACKGTVYIYSEPSFIAEVTKRTREKRNP